MSTAAELADAVARLRKRMTDRHRAETETFDAFFDMYMCRANAVESVTPTVKGKSMSQAVAPGEGWYGIFEGRNPDKTPNQDLPVRILGVGYIIVDFDKAGDGIAFVDNTIGGFVPARRLPGFIDVVKNPDFALMEATTGRVYREKMTARML